MVIFIELILLRSAALNKKQDLENKPIEEIENSSSQNLFKEFGEVLQTMQGVHVVEIKNDQREWELWSDVASTYKQTGNLSLQTVKTKFFGKEDTYFLVKGDSGSVISKNKDMFIQGGVETESSNGYLFTTEQIKYDSEFRELISESKVQITGPDKDRSSQLRLSGERLRADLQSSKIFIEGGVRAKKAINIKGFPLVNVRAEKAFLSAKTNEVSFSGDVSIDVQGMSISGPQATFLYKPNSGQIVAIELDGGVKVSDYDKWATSEKVRIDFDKDLYILKGAPKVIQENDELFGDEIIFLEGGKKVKVKNARVKVSGQNLESE